MTKTLYVRAFGKLELQYQEQRISNFPTRHVEELAVFLLLHPQTPHPREKLVTLLWPDSPADKGRARLSTALWRLRNLFDHLGLTADSCLHTTRDTITFAPEITAVLDTTCFEDLIIQAKTNRGHRTQLLQDAIALYQGELCEGIYADWCLLERERLSRHYLWALGQLMTHHLQAEQYGRAIEIGHTLLSHDPLREEVHRALMLCQQKLGQHNQALQQFQLCSDLLQDELDVIPMPETLALYQQILASRFQTLKAAPKRASDIEVAYAEFLRASSTLTKLLSQ